VNIYGFVSITTISRAVVMDTESNYLASEFVPEHFLELDTPVDSEFYVFGFGQR